jgi:hypothetical protein
VQQEYFMAKTLIVMMTIALPILGWSAASDSKMEKTTSTVKGAFVPISSLPPPGEAARPPRPQTYIPGVDLPSAGTPFSKLHAREWNQPDLTKENAALLTQISELVGGDSVFMAKYLADEAKQSLTMSERIAQRTRDLALMKKRLSETRSDAQ